LPISQIRKLQDIKVLAISSYHFRREAEEELKESRERRRPTVRQLAMAKMLPNLHIIILNKTIKSSSERQSEI